MDTLVNQILEAIPGSEVTAKDEFETTLVVKGVPGFVRVTEGGITMTFNNVIPGSVAVEVLQAVGAK